jgi:hypothetical protein
MFKSRRMRCVGHVARVGRQEMPKGFLSLNLKERVSFEDPGVDGRRI